MSDLKAFLLIMLCMVVLVVAVLYGTALVVSGVK